MPCLSKQRRGELQGKTMRHRKSAEEMKNKLGNGRTGVTGRFSLEEAGLSPSADELSSKTRAHTSGAHCKQQGRRGEALVLPRLSQF